MTILHHIVIRIKWTLFCIFRDIWYVLYNLVSIEVKLSFNRETIILKPNNSSSVLKL